MKKFFVFALLALVSAASASDEIALLKPDLSSGKPLMQCIASRRSSRSFSDKPLPLQIVSEVLFVADGITSPDGKKSVPTARNKQNQRVYAFRADGVYLYNSKKHSLVKVIGKDLRKICGKQPFHAVAPLVLVYVSEMTAVGNTPQLQALYSGNHSGHAAQNVYLYAASKNLSTVICGLLDRKLIKDTLKLNADDMVIFSQPVGFPEEM